MSHGCFQHLPLEGRYPLVNFSFRLEITKTRWSTLYKLDLIPNVNSLNPKFL